MKERKRYHVVTGMPGGYVAYDAWGNIVGREEVAFLVNQLIHDHLLYHYDCDEIPEDEFDNVVADHVVNPKDIGNGGIVYCTVCWDAYFEWEVCHEKECELCAEDE